MTDSSSPWQNNGNANRRAPGQSPIRQAPADLEIVEPLPVSVTVINIEQPRPRGHLLEASVIAAAIVIGL
jgi:hypothetical protein